MKKVILLLAILLSWSCASSPIQVSPQAGWLRTSIESYPEAERRPILNYLDAARLVADDAATRLVSGDVDSLVARLASNPRAGNADTVRQGIAQLRTGYGALTSADYRGQSVESQAVPPNVHDVAHASAVTFYSIKTTSRIDGELFLAIRTVLDGQQHQIVGMQYLDYRGNVPPWLAPPPQGNRP